MRIILASLFLCAVCSHSYGAETKNTQGHKEFNTLFLKYVMKPKLTLVQKAFESMKTWEDLELHLKTLQEKDQAAGLARLKALNTTPFKLPKISQSSSGFDVSSGKTKVEMNFITGLLSVGKKDFSFRGESFGRIMTWVEGHDKKSSVDLFVAAINLSTLESDQKKCQKAVNKFEGIVEITGQDCESSTLDPDVLKAIKKNPGKKEADFWTKAHKKSCADFAVSQFKSLNYTCLKADNLKLLCSGAQKLHACVFKEVAPKKK